MKRSHSAFSIALFLCCIGGPTFAQQAEVSRTLLPLIYIQQQEQASAAMRPSLLLATPILKYPADSADDQPFTLGLWCDTVPRAAFYRIQLSTHSDFPKSSSAVFDSLHPDSGFGEVIAAASLGSETRYFWRAQAFAGADASEWSPVRTFLTARDLSNDTIEILSPEPKKVFRYTGDQPTITQEFKWRSLPGAKYYVIGPLPKDTITDTSKIVQFFPPYPSPNAELVVPIFAFNGGGKSLTSYPRLYVVETNGVVDDAMSAVWLESGKTSLLHYRFERNERLRVTAVDILGRTEELFDRALSSTCGTIELRRTQWKPVLITVRTDSGRWSLRP